ncbi:MAG: hypothetical protein OXI87_04295 [Albidovulum sp.]|nr:hypothetical protein [Albidovulum sp.]MDE0304097.1 hypothetical protein [Albidovulum sp.]MDE0533364.1 hypothetical protein [Albidovulum sp.]
MQPVEEIHPDGMSFEYVLVHFQDEARIGQNEMLARVWARKGSRPWLPRDYRRGYRYLFSAACPEAGEAVGHACGKADTEEMNRHLRDVCRGIPEGGKC